MNWQPIETAPMETPILVTDGVVMVVAQFDPTLKTTWGAAWLDPVGFSGYEWEWDFDESRISHWMPLPEPPK